MRKRALALSVVLAVGACSTDPDYVAMTPPPQCDARSRLVRRGFPENLESVLFDNCTVTQNDQMRGPDFTSWLAGISLAITSCDSVVPIPLWTEKSPEGKITRIHFCPEFCLELKNRLLTELKKDVICPDEAGSIAGATATIPPFTTVAAGSGGNGLGGAGASGNAGGSAGSVAGAGAAGAPGASGAAGGTGGSGGVSAAAGSAGTSGASGAAGTS